MKIFFKDSKNDYNFGSSKINLSYIFQIQTERVKIIPKNAEIRVFEFRLFFQSKIEKG